MHVPECLHQPTQPTRTDMQHRQITYGQSTFPFGLLKYGPLPKWGDSLRQGSTDCQGQTGTLCSTPALAYTEMYQKYEILALKRRHMSAEAFQTISQAL